MKVVHFSTYESLGGAGRASYGIHTALVESECDSLMVAVHTSNTTERTLQNNEKTRQHTTNLRQMQLELLSSSKPAGDFSPDVSPFTTLDALQLPFVPDIIHLHSVAQFLTAHDIWNLWRNYQAPIVWTMMDMAPFTGGCHYSYGCRRFTDYCGACPLIHSSEVDDVSRRTWNAKDKWLRDVPITLVGPSQWSLDLAARSSLFSDAPQVRIPCGVDTNVYRPRSQLGVRRLLNLPEKTPIIFVGAVNWLDERKGMKFALESLQKLPHLLPDGAELPIILAAGGNELPALLSQAKLSLRCVPLVNVQNERLLAMGLQAADVFICPSTDDFGPMMIPMALLCGTPVVAFESCGFAPDVIQSRVNGYLAQTGDPLDMAQGIQCVLRLLESGHITRSHCHEGAFAEFALTVQAQRYLNLYHELLYS
ncbi:D-inositol-3-phosphate glycosyltransferase [Abditibacteriota bacterium]|nr:D-inositol-3-phosphate glycosyltransferase [Abditibacteriota bacterium]